MNINIQKISKMFVLISVVFVVTTAFAYLTSNFAIAADFKADSYNLNELMTGDKNDGGGWGADIIEEGTGVNVGNQDLAKQQSVTLVQKFVKFVSDATFSAFFIVIVLAAARIGLRAIYELVLSNGTAKTLPVFLQASEERSGGRNTMKVGGGKNANSGWFMKILSDTFKLVLIFAAVWIFLGIIAGFVVYMYDSLIN